MALPIQDIESRMPQVGGSLSEWGGKLNAIDQELADGINELYDDILEINGVSSGLATKLDKDGYIGTAQDLKDNIDLKEDKSNKGVANGYVPLNGSTLIDAQYLPSYVDDIIEGYYDSGIFYEDSGHTTPIVGTQGKVYVDITSGKTNQYRWSGNSYVFLGTGNLATTTTDGLMSADDKVQVGKYRVYDTVADMQLDSANITEGMTIQLLGYYSKNDGAGHVRKIEATDDGSGIAVGSLFANVIPLFNGEILVDWFGARGDCVAPTQFGVIPVGSDDTMYLKKALENNYNNVVFPPNKKYLITDTITPTTCNINFNNSTIVMDTTDKNKPIFVASGQSNKVWERGTMQGTSYIPLAGIKFNLPDNQAMKLINIRCIASRHGVFLNGSEVINRIIFDNCNFGSNLIAGVWFKSYESTYGHSGPVFFVNTIVNGNGLPSWIGSSTYKGVVVAEPELKWGVQCYFKGFSTLNWSGGQISDHSNNRCLALLLIENSNGITFRDFDFEDFTNPVRLDGTLITDTSTNETIFNSKEGGSITLSTVSDAKIELTHTTSISQQSLIKIEYTCHNVELSLPIDSKISGCRYSVDYHGKGANSSNIIIKTPTSKISNRALTNVIDCCLKNILSAGNKTSEYYLPVGGINTHFDEGSVTDSGTKYPIYYSTTGDLKTLNSCCYKLNVYGIEALGIKVYARDKGYNTDCRLVVSYYDSSDIFLSSSEKISIRPTDNNVDSYGLIGLVSKVPTGTKYARVGFINSSNYIAKIPDHAEPISVNVYALGSLFKINPVTRNFIV